jgi:hypothetical protein
VFIRASLLAAEAAPEESTKPHLHGADIQVIASVEDNSLAG